MSLCDVADMSLEALRQPGQFLPLRRTRQGTADLGLVILEATYPFKDPINLVASLQQLCSRARVAPQIGRLPALFQLRASRLVRREADARRDRGGLSLPRG